MKKFVYLAGPIESCNTTEINAWRIAADRYLRAISDDQIQGINPFRSQEVKYEGDYQTAMQIHDKNYYDTKNCDVVLAYMPRELNERRPSYGTAFEVAWANLLRKPIFIVTDDPVVIRHPLFKASTQYFYKDVNSACDAINDLMEVYS